MGFKAAFYLDPAPGATVPGTDIELVEILAIVDVSYYPRIPATLTEPAEGGPEFESVEFHLIGPARTGFGMVTEAQAFQLVDHGFKTPAEFRAYLEGLNAEAYHEREKYLTEIYAKSIIDR